MRASRLTPWLLVATLTAAGAAAAAGYGLTAPKRYRATAKILVSPVSTTDPTFAGLGLLRDANGRHTAAASAASLVETPQVADAVRAQLGLRRSSTSLLHDVSTKVAKDSDVVLVTGKDGSGVGAAQLANAFVDALIAQRNSSFQSQLASAVQRDAQLLAAGSPGPQTAELAHMLALLRSFQGQPDPTLRRASTAIAPTAASWPDLPELVLTGAGAGLAAAALLSLGLALVRRRGPAYDRPVDSTSEALVDRLEQRLAARESALAARERDLQARIDELRALEARPVDDSALHARERELVERERALAERVAAVTKRELAVARAAAAQAQQRRPEPEPERLARPAPVPVAAAAGDGAYNLTTLERLVHERGGEHPERAEEWDSYLYFLRDYAAADGSIPLSFDALVEETFRPLLD
jgi:capsular polysaccharide biosynthesis protein